MTAADKRAVKRIAFAIYDGPLHASLRKVMWEDVLITARTIWEANHA